MSDLIVTYAQDNKLERYNLLASSEKRSLDSIVTNFIQELVTKKGSNAFDREYGTLFIDNLGTQVNVYKLDYFLKREISGMKNKYQIVSGAVTKAWVEKGSSILNIEITLDFNNATVSSYVDFRFDGNFTEKDLIEYT